MHVRIGTLGALVTPASCDAQIVTSQRMKPDGSIGVYIGDVELTAEDLQTLEAWRQNCIRIRQKAEAAAVAAAAAAGVLTSQAPPVSVFSSGPAVAPPVSSQSSPPFSSSAGYGSLFALPGAASSSGSASSAAGSAAAGAYGEPAGFSLAPFPGVDQTTQNGAAKPAGFGWLAILAALLATQ